MVLALLVPAAVAFVIGALAAYVGALRALEVYFDPNRDSVFLVDDRDQPERR
ncbi:MULTISPECIES: hypothetical protein [Halorubrum]|uniref:Uncharacterized protein n=1 Tax=Halorubrum hochstenium ATCC 700873 TaxID=1227481 RepID=M0F3T5_9EURY|nr:MULTISPECIES: hypothetical protein [Halorubrum]ELZ54560.1 hypothetical protein C467_11425 [Halorubrum hochstenium ATCC 700873]